MLSKFLENRLKERRWSLNHLHVLTGGSTYGIPYATLRLISIGKTKSPDIDTLKKIAKAFGDPVTEWMRAAGYLDELPEVEAEIVKRFGLLFDNPEAAKVLTRRGVVDHLKRLGSLSDDNLAKALDFFETYLKGVD